MVAKLAIDLGTSFPRLCVYAMNEDKDAEVLASAGVRTDCPARMAADFKAQEQLRPGLGRSLMHVALAWPNEEQDKLTNETMTKLVMEYLKEIGIKAANTQWAVVRHYDQAHPHCHLIINRIDNDGVTIKDTHNFRDSVKACRTLEKRHGLINAEQIGDEKKQKEAAAGQLHRHEAASVHIKAALRLHLPGATTVEGLALALAGEGITMRSIYQQQKLQGVVFEHGGEHVKGSAIGREFGGNRLRETLDAQVVTQAAVERQEAVLPMPAPVAQVRVAVADVMVPMVVPAAPVILPVSALAAVPLSPVLIVTGIPLQQGRIALLDTDRNPAAVRGEQVREALVAAGATVGPVLPATGVGKGVRLMYSFDPLAADVAQVNEVLARVACSAQQAIWEHPHPLYQPDRLAQTAFPATEWPAREGQFAQALIVIDDTAHTGQGRAERIAADLRREGAFVGCIQAEGHGCVEMRVHYHTHTPTIESLNSILDRANASPGIEVRESSQDRNSRYQGAVDLEINARSQADIELER